MISFDSGRSFYVDNIGGSKDDEAVTVRAASDGGYYLVGNTKSQGKGGSDVYLVKTDASGKILWEKTYGGAKDDFGWGLRILRDGDLLITGFSDSEGNGKDDVMVIRCDKNGDQKWIKYFGGQYDDRSWEVIESKNGNIVIAAEYSIADNKANIDGWLLILDSDGKQVSSTKYGYSSDNDKVDRLFSVVEDNDGGFIMSGFTNSAGAGDYDVLVIKADQQGKEQWRKTFGGSRFDVGHTIKLLDGKGYMVCGYTRSARSNGKGDVYLLQLERTGKILKERSFGEENEERTLTFAPRPDGGFVLLGYAELTSTNWDAILIEVDNDLNQVNSKKIGKDLLDTGGHNILCVENDYVFTGYITKPGYNKDIYLTRTSF